MLAFGNRGLFSFILLLVFLQIILSAAEIQSKTLEKTSSYENTAMQIEKANYVRVEIEGNFDSVVRNVLEQELLLNNSEHHIRERIANEIAALISKYESKRKENPKVDFWLEEYELQKYSEVECGENSQGFSSAEIMERILVEIERIEEGIVKIKFTYRGGVIPKKIICAKIETSEYMQEFFLPLNYTIEVP